MANITMKSFLFILLFTLSVVVASDIKARVPTPSKRYALPGIPPPPAPSKVFGRRDSPSKRSLDERAPAPGPSAFFVARDPSPSKRFIAREPAPSKRLVDREPAPSKRFVDREPAPSKRFVAREPAPSKRLVDREPAPSKRLVAREPAPSKRLIDRAPAPAPSKRVTEDSAARKRSIEEQRVVGMDSERGFCLDGLMACPILSTPGQFPHTFSEWEAVGFECVDFAADLGSCGGCSSLDPVE
jgi:hypothetical protein